MKRSNRHCLLFVFLFINLSCYGQYSSTLNIWLGDKQLLNEDYVLLLNNRRITSFKPKELVVYKVYSSGPLNIEIIYAKTGIIKYSEQFNISELNEYFFHANTEGYPPKTFIEKLSFEEARQYFDNNDYFVKKRIFKEDINNPIGNFSKDLFRKQPSQGTGFLLNNEGHVLTNFHIIEGSKKILVSGINGDPKISLSASVVAVDRLLDIAILKIENDKATFSTPPYTFPATDEVKKGESIFALGYPIADALGRELKVTDGIINSTTGFKNSISTLQFSAPVQPGNSGGPLVNMKGEIIGLISSKISSSSTESIGYALKTSYIMFFLSQLENVNVKKPTNEKAFVRNLPEMVSKVKNFIYIIRAE